MQIIPLTAAYRGWTTLQTGLANVAVIFHHTGGWLLPTLIGVLFAADVTHAQSTWNDSESGYWGVATNWIPATVPNGANAVISINSNVTVDVENTTTGGAYPYIFGTLATTNVSGNVMVGNQDVLYSEQLTAQTSSGVPVISINSGATLWAYFVLNGTQGFNKTGGGQLTFRYNPATQSYTGNVIISAGSLCLNVDANLGNTNNGIIFSNNAVLLFNPTTLAPVALAPTRNITLACTAANIDVAGTNWLAIPGVINEIVAGSGLQKTDSGTLVLSGVNTYTGVTTISGGTLTISGSGQLGSGSYSANIANSGTFNFNSSAVQTLAGAISGSGSLNLISSGVLILAAANTYSGATTIGDGTLALGSTGSINSTAAISIGAGATYDVSAISSYILSGSTSLTASGVGAAAILKGATGGTVNLGSRPITLNFDGSNPALVISQGNLSLSGQTITVNTLRPLANGTYNLIKQTTGNVVNTGSYTLAGTAGTGTITFSGGNVQMDITGSSITATTTTLSGNDAEIYDNNSIITATVSPNTASGTVQFYVDGIALGNAVPLSSGSAAIPSTSTVAAGAHSITAVYSGTTGYSPSAATNAAILTVTPRSLTVSAIGVNKTYDGTTNATVSLSDNRVSGDNLTDSYASAYFADPNIGTNKPVSVFGISISGSAAGNYSLANTTATTTASILAVGAPDQFDTLRLAWESKWVIGNPSASTLSSWAATANTYWSTLNTNSARSYLWSEYPFMGNSGDVTSTFSQLEAMALAWAAPGCSLYGNPALASAITNALDWMCANVYTTTASEYGDWFDWEIGSARALNNVVVLMYPVLTSTQIVAYNNSEDHFLPPYTSWMTGSNLSDKSLATILCAIIGKNSGQLCYGQTNLSPVFLYVTNSDGFYRDGSFLFHVNEPYTGGYGGELVTDVGQLVTLLNGSTWQITDPNLTNVFNWAFNSYEPVIYYGEWMAMVCGRTIARGPASTSSQGVLTPIAQCAPPATSAAITAWVNSPLLQPSQYQFADMDCAVAWRSNFCVGLRMSSSRVANFESFSGENLHGWFTGDGMMYLYMGNPDTQFTSDFWPTVDPYHLPGTTEATTPRPNYTTDPTFGEEGLDARQTTGQTWVGGAQVANSFGVSGMSLASVGTTMTAKKSWFMFDNEIVCLGSSVTCGDAAEVDTTVEDRRLGTSPTNNFTVNGVVYKPVMGWSSNLTTTTWCALEGTGGYYFPGAATNLHAAFVANKGAWSQIDYSTDLGYAIDTNLYTDDYLTLWFNHSIKPTNSTYAYVILPNFTASDMATYAANPDIIVLTNSANVQAASKPALGVVAANFWVDGTNSADLITVNKKSSVITSANMFQIAVGVSDPTQTNSGSINVTLNRSASGILSVDPGVTVLQLSPQIVLSVNVGGSAGKSFQAVFSSPTNALVWDANPSASGTHPLDGSGTWNSSNTNWWNGSADVAWNDANPLAADFGATGTAGTVTVTGAHTTTWLLFNPPASGTYTLSGTGALTITNGILANTSANVNVPVILPVSQTWTVTSNQVVSLGGAVTLGSGAVLSLTGGGAVQLNAGNNQLPATTTMTFVGNGIFDLGGNSQLVANILPPSSCVGSVQNGNLTVTATGGFSPFGTLTGSSTLDLSGLSSFTYSNGSQNFTVQGTTAVSGNFNLNLAGSNSITAANIYVGNGGGTTLPTGNLFLGQTNSFNTANFQLGAYRGSGNVYFESGLDTSNVTFRGVAGGTSRLGTMSIGWNQSGAVQNQVMDLGTANVDALIGTLNLLYTYQPEDASTATLNFGNGTFDITTLNLFNLAPGNSGTSTGSANFNQNGGLAKIQTLNMGYNSIPATGLAAFNPNYTLASGATLAAQTITAAAGTPYNPGTVRNLNVNGGTVSNYDANTDLTISGADGSSGGVVNINLGAGTTSTFNAGSGRNITIQSTAPISGSGNLNKTGAGTLTLVGTHPYTGTTVVSAGTMLVNGALGTNTMIVASGATLGGSGSIGGITMLQSGGTIQPGNGSGIGTLTNGTLNLGDSFSAATGSRFNIAAGGKILAAALNVSGTHTINFLDTSLPLGTNTLITYTGAMGGSGFAGLKLGTVPSLPNGATAYLRNTGSAVQLVVAPLVAPVLFGSATYGVDGFSLNFSGMSGQSYKVLASTNVALPLTNWLTLTNGFFGTGAINFVDSAATNQQKYYRVASP